MKRFVMGTVWCVLFWLAANLAIGWFAGAAEGARANGFELGYALADIVRDVLQDRDALLLTAAAVLTAVLGTLTGLLPGTRRKKKPKASRAG